MRSRILPGSVARSQPATRAVPPLGGISVASMRSVVVLPAPFGPRKPKISPRRTLRSTPATASTTRLRVWKTRRKPRVSIIASGSAVPIRRDFAGSSRRPAGKQVPEGLLGRPATRGPANHGDRPHDGRDRKPLQQAAGEVRRDGPPGQRGKPKPRRGGRPHVLRVPEVQALDPVIRVTDHVPGVSLR